MQRLTKAAIATGGAAVLLLGGAGTYAFWTADATSTGSSFTSGTLTAANGTCSAWTYQTGGGAVTLVVPGDVVQTTCTMTVTGTGDHLAVNATLGNATWATANALTAAVTLSTGALTVDGTAATNPIDLSAGGTHTVTVVVTATFPYGTATSPDNTTQNLTATLSNVTVTFDQAQTAANPAT
ncbi:MAG: alternate-type signal peptide domain-containing protein [Promicromonosporaceae bacterium]|nr:alternate-type signal peptide domain-containing protein [Promicromonosporaceae bacterium]